MMDFRTDELEHLILILSAELKPATERKWRAVRRWPATPHEEVRRASDDVERIEWLLAKFRCEHSEMIETQTTQTQTESPTQ